MKKIIILIVIVLLAQISYSQININSSGNVGIKKSASSTYDLDIDGTIAINGGHSWASLIFDDSKTSGGNNLVTIRPSNAWYASLGTETYYFGYSYVKQMSSESCFTETLRSNSFINNYGYTFSDERIKTNIKGIETPLDFLLKLEGKQYDMTPINQGLGKDKERKEKKGEYGFIAQDFMKILPELVVQDSLTGLYAINYIGVIPIMVEALKEQQAQIESMQKQIDKLVSKN